MRGSTTKTTNNPPVSIQNIKELHDFQFFDRGILARKLSGM